MQMEIKMTDAPLPNCRISNTLIKLR